MCGTTYAGHRPADINGGFLSLVEKVGIQNDLTIGDGDQVGGDVAGDIAVLSGGNRQRGD